MSRTKVLQIGKYKCTVIVHNEPSEEAILNCRKFVTRMMDELYESGELEELLGLTKPDNEQKRHS